MFTTTANQTAKILKSNSPDLSDALASISHKSMASVYYIIPDQLISISKKSSGVIIAKSDQNNITACTISSLKFKRDETQSGDLIRAFIRSKKTFVRYELFELNGRVILQNQLDDNSIDISNLEANIYYLRLFDDLNNHIVKKIVKN